MIQMDKLLRHRPEGCLSDLTAELYLSGELAPAEVASVESHFAGCAACDEMFDAMKNVTWRPDSTAVSAIRERVSGQGDPVVLPARIGDEPMPARLIRRLGRPSVLVLVAAAFLVLIAVPLVYRHFDERSVVREKGGAVIRVFVKTPEGSRPGDSGERLRQGDAIKFAVNPGEHRYVMVVNVEERGRVTRYHPQRGESAPIEPRRETLLPASITLDDYRGLERIFAVFSPEPLSFDEVAAAVAKAAGTGGRLDLRTVTALPLSHSQASFLISKE